MTRTVLCLSCGWLLLWCSLGHGATSTPPNLTVAFFGDQGLTPAAKSVLQLIKAEGANLAVHVGDFDYANRPDLWEGQINSILGTNFPYLGVVGNHDTLAWLGPSGYRQRLINRAARTGISCTGDMGVKATCTYQGLTFILSGVGSWPIVDQRIALSDRDAEEYMDGRVVLTSTDLEFMHDVGLSVQQRMIGMRWPLPHTYGDTISSARLQLTVDEVGSRLLNLRIWA
jgi:hypothetical protein